jgi:hypothetical protein
MCELLPPYAKNVAHVSEPAIGVLWFVLAGAVALGQLPVVKLVECRRRMRGLALMGVIWAATFLTDLVGGTWFTGTQAALIFAVAVTGFALGECLHGAIYAPLAVDLTLWLAAAAVSLLASAYALSLERLIPERLHRTPHVDSLAGVRGTMANMAPATDEPLSTDAKPPPHQEDQTSRLRRGSRTAPGTTRR